MVFGGAQQCQRYCDCHSFWERDAFRRRSREGSTCPARWRPTGRRVRRPGLGACRSLRASATRLRSTHTMLRTTAAVRPDHSHAASCSGLPVWSLLCHPIPCPAPAEETLSHLLLHDPSVHNWLTTGSPLTTAIEFLSPYSPSRLKFSPGPARLPGIQPNDC